MAVNKVAVIGGGISGLSYGYFFRKSSESILTLRKNKPQLSLYEASSTPGGWMSSTHDEKTGAIFENGPHSLRAIGHPAQTTLSLAEDLGLSSQVIGVSRNCPAGKNRLIYAQEKLHQLNLGYFSMFRRQRPLSTSLARCALQDLRTPRPDTPLDDESIHDFVCRRFGHEAADYLVDAFIRGILAGDARETSVKSFMPRLKLVEDKYGSILRNLGKVPVKPITEPPRESALCRKALNEKWAMWNFTSGIQTLPLALYEKIIELGGDVHLNSPVASLRKSEDGGFILTTINGTEERYDAVISTINATALARLLPTGKLSETLAEFPSVNVAVVRLEYPADQHRTPQAFGHLIPSIEKSEKNLGVIYDSTVFPEHDRRDRSTTRVSVMMGGAWFNEIFPGGKPTSREIDDIAVDSVARQLGFHSDPVTCSSSVVWNAIPQYPLGHSALVDKVTDLIMKEALPLTLIGPSFYQPGVNDNVDKAKAAALGLLTQLDMQDYITKVDESKQSKLTS